jgi:hypothetical protein
LQFNELRKFENIVFCSENDGLLRKRSKKPIFSAAKCSKKR